MVWEAAESEYKRLPEKVFQWIQEEMRKANIVEWAMRRG